MQTRGMPEKLSVMCQHPEKSREWISHMPSNEGHQTVGLMFSAQRTHSLKEPFLLSSELR